MSTPSQFFKKVSQTPELKQQLVDAYKTKLAQKSIKAVGKSSGKYLSKGCCDDELDDCTTFQCQDIPDADPLEFDTLINDMFLEVYRNWCMLYVPKKVDFGSGTYHIAQDFFLIQGTEIGKLADETFRKLHEREASTEMYLYPDTDHLFVYAPGSTGIINGLLYAIAYADLGTNFVFAEKKPHYSFHSEAIDVFQFSNASFQSFTVPGDLVLNPGDVLIEWVTSPNTPDGVFREPETNANIILVDLVFANECYTDNGTGFIPENIAWIRAARDAGKLVLTFTSASKALGFTADRLGWMWFPLIESVHIDVSDVLINLLINLIAAGMTSSQGIQNVLDHVCHWLNMPDNGILKMRKDINCTFKLRQDQVLQELNARYGPGVTSIAEPGTDGYYNTPVANASTVIGSDTNTFLLSGDSFQNDGNTKVRMSLGVSSLAMSSFLNRIAQKPCKYTPRDTLCITVDSCPITKICGTKCRLTYYTICIGQSLIEVDSTCGPITVVLTPFLNTQGPEFVTIKRINNKGHPVKVISDFTSTKFLRCSCKSVSAKWTQPGYFNPQWELVGDNCNIHCKSSCCSKCTNCPIDYNLP